jgi:hypothetical protein
MAKFALPDEQPVAVNALRNMGNVTLDDTTRYGYVPGNQAGRGVQ